MYSCSSADDAKDDLSWADIALKRSVKLHTPILLGARYSIVEGSRVHSATVANQQQADITANVECFRGIEHVELKLSRLTILTGRNNAGKSSLLEALAIAFTAPALRDWAGNDVVRIIIDDKLAGAPLRLLNTACTSQSAIISMHANGVRPRVAQVVIRRPGESEIKLLFCKLLASLRERLYHDVMGGGDTVRCLRRKFRNHIGDKEASALATLIATVAFTLIGALEDKVCKSNVLEELLAELVTLPEDVKQHFHRMATIGWVDIVEKAIVGVVEELLRYSIVVKTEGLSRIYLPNYNLRFDAKEATGYHEALDNAETTVSNSVARVTGSILYLSALKDLYARYARLQLSGLANQLIESCIGKTLRKSIKENLIDSTNRYAITISGPETHEDVKEKCIWNVFLGFRRGIVLRRSLLHPSTPTEIVKCIHGLGLLGEYNEAIKKLGLKDPLVEDNEVYLIHDGMRKPLALLGDGTLHLLVLLAGLTLAKREPNIVVLLEEPETGLHPGYLLLLADLMAAAVRENPSTFIVFSTHSEELIRYVVKRAEKQNILNSVKVALMSRGRVKAEFHSREIIESLEDIGVELRGL